MPTVNGLPAESPSPTWFEQNHVGDGNSLLFILIEARANSSCIKRPGVLSVPADGRNPNRERPIWRWTVSSKTFCRATQVLILGSWVFVTAVAAQTGTALLQAKKEAEAKGFIFAASHDEILARAKKEGKLVVLSSQDAAAVDATAKAFKKKYPFIDVKASEIGGTDTYLRMIGELKIGKTTDWDVNYVAFDYYDDYLPHQKKFDMLGMARHGVLRMPPDMIDPVNRHIIVLQTNMQALAFNKKTLAKDKVPDNFEDLLKPEFKGNKFALDIR